jgi:aryl-alcohol dehydrogenase-like predicted oxidoreductase
MTIERTLGRSGLTTPPLILGGNVFSWTADRDTSFTILDAFVAGGGRMIDTADGYTRWLPGHSGGESEAIIGEWLAARGRRDDVLVATKVGVEMNGEKGLKPDRVLRACEASLKRLRTDYIDLYYAHYDDPETPFEETLRAYDRLVRDGKVRAIGASNITAPRLAQALDTSAAKGLASYTVLQPEYNLVARNSFEGPLQDLCLERGLAAVPYYGLASGFLTGKYRSREDLQGRARERGAGKHATDFGFAVLETVRAVAAEAGATPAQVALAWLMVQPAVTAPIASATSVAQVEELLGAMRLTLTPAQLTTLAQSSLQST